MKALSAGGIVLLAFLIAACGGCCACTRVPRSGEPPNAGGAEGPADKMPEIIHLPQAYERYFSRGADAMWVDVRDPDPYKAGHIKGAVNIPLAALVRSLDQIPTDRIVVLYCESPVKGVRCGAAGSAARILIEYGYSPGRIKVFEDGPDVWRRAGHPMEP